MVRPLAAFALIVPMLTPAAPAAAESRRIGVGSFDRVRIEGAYRVAITTGASPAAAIAGDDGNGVDLRAEGGTLVIRRTSLNQWGERGTAASAPVTITLSTPALVAASVAGGAEVTVTRMQGPRVELALGGGGALIVDAVQTDQLNAQLVGDGRIALAGRAGNARLTASGAGAIDAAKLDVGDLIATHQGLGQIAARARYSAQVSNAGLGSVTVAGKPKCRLVGQPSGTVQCGTGD